MSNDVICALPGRQTRFLELYHVKRLLWAGEKGSGKTHICSLDFLRDVHHADARALFIRKTFPSLQSAIVKFRDIFKHVGGEYNGQTHTFNFPSGAQFVMRCLDTQSDLETVTGQEYSSGIYIDEAGFIPTEHVELVFSCGRTTNPDINTRLRLLTNPQGISAHTLWEEYVYKHAEGEVKFWGRDINSDDDDWIEVNGGESKTWLFSKRSENTYLKEDYEKTLSNLSRDLRRAYLTGELVIESESDQLIPYEHIDAALSKPEKELHGFHIVSLDVGGAGNDPSIIYHGQGDQVIEILQYKNKTIPELISIMSVFLREYKNQCLLIIDSVGLGTGVVEGLKEKFPQHKEHIIGIGSKSAGLDEKMKKQKYAPTLKFRSFRDWIYWEARLCYEQGKINLSRVRNNKYINILKKELGAIKWTDISGVVETTSKKELKKAKNLGTSPDHADANVYYIIGLLHYSDRMKYTHRPDGNGWSDYNSGKPDATSQGIQGSGDLSW